VADWTSDIYGFNDLFIYEIYNQKERTFKLHDGENRFRLYASLIDEKQSKKFITSFRSNVI